MRYINRLFTYLLTYWWSVECFQQLSTTKYVDNSKRRLRLYQSTATSQRTGQNLFVRIGKSEAEVGLTNNKRLLGLMRSRYCTVETNDI